MKRSAVAAALAGLVMAMPAYAQTMTGIFTAKGDRVAAKPAKISFPKKITTLSLVNTMEFSRPGESLDSAAEYTADGGLKATVYIYRPGYPDAALAAFETDRIMPRLYGAAISRTSQAAVPLGGRATAIRISYKGAVLDGRPFATASAFARIGGWIVKLRVSGPADHQAEVDAALDALLSGAEIDKDAVLFSTAPLDFGPPCPATTSGTVKSAKGEKSGANALGSAIMAVTLDSPPKDKTSVPPPFPANGMTKVCSRGLVGQLDDGAILEGSESFQRIAQTRGLPRDNH